MRKLIGRRGFLNGVLACGCLVCGLGGNATAQEPKRRYCLDAVGGSAGPSVAVDDLSQAVAFDYLKAVIAHIRREQIFLTQFFEVQSPIYLKPQGGSAYADPPKQAPDGSRQSAAIVLGLRFLQYRISLSNGYFPISGILAHEKSHVFQYHWGLDVMLGNVRGQKVKYVELHADYLSGAYMAWRRNVAATKADELSQLFYSLGDRAVDSEDHHGTQEERFKAYANGYFEFLSLKEKGRPENVVSAATMGALYVQKILSLS
jgi:hypothetical protein